MLPFYRRPISRKTVLIVLLTPVTATGVPALLWLGWNARPLNIAREFNIQTPALPSPNAYDLYEKSAKAFYKRKDSKQPAAQILDIQAEPDAVEDPKKYPLVEKKLWLARNREGFQLFDQALQAQFLFPPIRSAQPRGYIADPYWLEWLARYATVECDVLAVEGQHARAVERAIDIWKLGLDGARGAPLTAAIKMSKVEGHARNALDGKIAHLNGAQARLAASRMGKLLATRVTYEAILREDQNVTLLQIKPLMESGIHEKIQMEKIDAAFEHGEADYKIDTNPPPELRGPIINWTVRRSANNTARGMELLYPQADAPWPRRLTIFPADLDPKITKYLGVLEKTRFLFVRNQAFGNLFLARLALHAYRKDKGVYPPNLESLVPTYLNKAPLDPFSDNQLLRYKLAGKRYELWSIGPDGRDDNARLALNTAQHTPKYRYQFTIDSTGDIVAQISQ